MKKLEIVIIGGGLAGLTAAIHLTFAGMQVRLFEKEKYPHHKVCGEYLSREILPYMKFLNIPVNSLNGVDIDKLFYSSTSGKVINANLPLGGIGVSRYALDDLLYKKACKNGTEVVQETVTSIYFEKEGFQITTADGNTFNADIVLGAYGKRSLLDKKLDRKFINKKTGWLAVKAHYKMEEYPEDTVGLHNFHGGYCGLSKTETSAVNVCYLATYKSFKQYKNPDSYKNEVLVKNKHLKEFFEKATPMFSQDLTIAQISFDKKSKVKDHILMLGDSAGLIHPLCGNGMAMAIHSAKIASEIILKHSAENNFNRKELEKEYEENWSQNFSSRLKTGRILQKILLNPALAEFSQNALSFFPSILPGIIKLTHGKQVL